MTPRYDVLEGSVYQRTGLERRCFVHIVCFLDYETKRGMAITTDREATLKVDQKERRITKSVEIDSTAKIKGVKVRA